MSGEIFIETEKARSFGLPLSEHLYLVFRDSNGGEYVLRSGPPSIYWPFGEMKIEVNVPIGESADDRGGDTPEERSSTPLDFPDLTDDQAWAIMVKYARLLDDADYRYDLLDENSNTFIGALLHAAGGQPAEMLPTGIDSGEAVGFSSWDNIVDDVAPPEDWIFRGTAGPDRMTGLQIDEEIWSQGGDDVVNAGRGNDSVLAGAGNDIVRAGPDNDTVHGEDGDDRLFGGSGTDLLLGGPGNDLLNGGAGRDNLDGGPGNDRLIGGAGVDWFVFATSGADEVDRIADFEPGIDRLQVSGVSAFEDIALSDVTGDGTSVAELAWDSHRVRLVGVEVSELTSDAFAFV